MIKKFIDRLIGRHNANPSGAKSSTRFGKQRVILLREHNIDLDQVDERAIDVVQTLQDRGFEAYIVGGAVRDLLLGIRPKDFDVATNATPEEVKSLFRRAFIIGRRFRIVHVVYARGREHEVVEVSTFRAYLDSADAHQVKGNERSGKKELAGVSHAVDGSGRVLRDNVWGPMDEDATRRDFTVNAMYYDPLTQEVIDFHGGFEDSRKRIIKMIGDPSTRYREDPVRIIRAVRFVAKLNALGFKLEKNTAKPLKSMVGLLEDVPPSRLFDETLKLLQTGHALASIEQLIKLDLSTGIYPILDLVVERSNNPMVHAALADTDRRVAEGKPVVPSFLLSCLLWQDVLERWQDLEQQMPILPALHEAIDSVFESRIGDVSGRGKLAGDMREIWSMQTRFDKQTGRSPLSLVEQPRFRASFDFLRLRSKVGEVSEELVQWWEDFSKAYPDEREQMLEDKRVELQKLAQRGSSRGPRGGSQANAKKPPRLPVQSKETLVSQENHGVKKTLPDMHTEDSLNAQQEPSKPRRPRRRRRAPSGAAKSDAPVPGESAQTPATIPPPLKN